MWSANTQGLTTSTARAVSDGQPHHLVCTRSTTGTALAIYLDGVLQGSSSGAAVSFLTGADTQIGVDPFGGVPALTGVIDEFAMYNVALSQTQITNHYNAARAPLSGQTTGARLTSILSAIGWPTTLQVLDTRPGDRPGRHERPDRQLGPGELSGDR
jgi:hypothetical protein